MDSLTQIVLGAAVAEVVAGKKLGNKAILWGGIGGTIPDLDVLGGFFLNEVDYVNFHRGYSHSLLFGFLVAPLLGWLISRSRWSQEQPYSLWTQLFFWTIFTHPLLDIFTSYGTQIFLPFSDYRVELNTIFIIDPAYTLPMMVTVIMAMFYKRESSRRRKIIYSGILLSHVYLLFTLFNKYYMVNPYFRQEMERQHLEVEMFQTLPAPFQNFLWQGIIKTPQGYYAGYFTPGKENNPLGSFIFFKRDQEVENRLEAFSKYKGLKKFSCNYHLVEKVGNNKYLYNDMRFSTAKGWLEKDADFIFSFELNIQNGEMTVKRNYPDSRFQWEDLSRIFNRLITD